MGDMNKSSKNNLGGQAAANQHFGLRLTIMTLLGVLIIYPATYVAFNMPLPPVAERSLGEMAVSLMITGLVVDSAVRLVRRLINWMLDRRS